MAALLAATAAAGAGGIAASAATGAAGTPEPLNDGGAAAGFAGAMAHADVPGLDCWAGDITFDLCCAERELPAGFAEGERGNPHCWDTTFTFDSCCIPEIRRRIAKASNLSDEGAWREASDILFQLFTRYATEKTASEEHMTTWFMLQRTVKYFRKELHRLPDSISYQEVLVGSFRGWCNVSEFNVSLGSSPVRDLEQCCRDPNGDIPWDVSCDLFQGLIAAALGRKHGATQEDKDAYYGTLSEAWAFRHFTPSLLTHDEPAGFGTGVQLQRARAIDVPVAAALEGAGDPTLGIMWAQHVPSHRSPKFMNSVFYLTALLHTLRNRKVGSTADSGIDFFEIGAGYGTIPRILASSRGRLAELGVHMRSFTVFDMRFAIDLQRWYLNRTVGNETIQRDWADIDIEKQLAPGWGRPGWAAKLWQRQAQPQGSNVAQAADAEDAQGSAGRTSERPSTLSRSGSSAPPGPLPVDFVDRDRRDVFAHLYSEAHARRCRARAAEPGRGEAHGAHGEAHDPVERPTRVLLAVNSWHEFPLNEFLWYYNAFVASPTWRMGADWIFYVSNRHWHLNDDKEALLLQKRSDFALEVADEWCTDVHCVRLLRRGAAEGCS